jgi:hypothetical protein
MTQSIQEYMESRRKEIDRYVQGEHAWYGDLCTALPSLSYNADSIPWYLKPNTDSKQVCVQNTHHGF